MLRTILAIALLSAASTVAFAAVPPVPPAAIPPSDAAVPREQGWTKLFDGRTLEGWKLSNFGGEGNVTVKDGSVLLEIGADLTGIHTERKLPRMNYEVSLEARRVSGTDFFCGLTFPVRKDSCSLILGGWGGGVCGLSTIDHYDASENDTTTYRKFEKGKWYRVRLRVTEPRIQAWVDEKRIVDQNIEGKKIAIRPEVDPSRPFGIAAWRTKAELRKIHIRKLSAAEIEKNAKAAKD